MRRTLNSRTVFDNLPWPTNSPDLNPIEHLWILIGRDLNRRLLSQNVDDLCTAMDGISHTVEILDTAGSHHFPAMRELSIRSGRGFLLVYSVDSLQSFREAAQLFALIQDIRARRLHESNLLESSSNVFKVTGSIAFHHLSCYLATLDLNTLSNLNIPCSSACGDGRQQVRPGDPPSSEQRDGREASERVNGRVRILRSLRQVRHQRERGFLAAPADGQDAGGSSRSPPGRAGLVQTEEQETVQETQPKALLLQQHGVCTQEEPFPYAHRTPASGGNLQGVLLQELQGQPKMRADLKVCLLMWVQFLRNFLKINIKRFSVEQIAWSFVIGYKKK
ncbi:GTP-binding protein Di-Ras1 [Trichonephila clavipes]|nr:GTP-binding protein Di-Ras1 [Trichonephila clavipes]